MTNDLTDTNTSAFIDSSISTDDTADTALYAKVFTGTGAATGVQMSKIGDIYIKTDTGSIYIAKSTTKSSGWVTVDVTA